MPINARNCRNQPVTLEPTIPSSFSLVTEPSEPWLAHTMFDANYSCLELHPKNKYSFMTSSFLSFSLE